MIWGYHYFRKHPYDSAHLCGDYSYSKPLQGSLFNNLYSEKYMFFVVVRVFDNMIIWSTTKDDDLSAGYISLRVSTSFFHFSS